MTAPGGAEDWWAVVVNEEDQYSLWPPDKPLPPGWRLEGFSGSREACLTYVDTVWTDMTPRSVREWIESGGDAPAA